MDCQLFDECSFDLDLLLFYDSEFELDISMNSVIFLTSCLFLGGCAVLVGAVGGRIDEWEEGAIERKPLSDCYEVCLKKVFVGVWVVLRICFETWDYISDFLDWDTSDFWGDEIFDKRVYDETDF